LTCHVLPYLVAVLQIVADDGINIGQVKSGKSLYDLFGRGPSVEDLSNGFQRYPGLSHSNSSFFIRPQWNVLIFDFHWAVLCSSLHEVVLRGGLRVRQPIDAFVVEHNYSRSLAEKATSNDSSPDAT